MAPSLEKSAPRPTHVRGPPKPKGNFKRGQISNMLLLTAKSNCFGVSKYEKKFRYYKRVKFQFIFVIVF